MTLLETLHAERKERLVRLGTLPKPDESAALVTALSRRIEKLQKTIEELHEVIGRQRDLISKFADEGEMPVPLINDIVMTVAEYYNFSKAQLMGMQRPHGFVCARQIIFFLANEAGYSYPHIGRSCNRDHTTCLYGAQKIRAKLETDVVLRKHVETIRARVMAYAAARIELSKTALEGAK